VDLKQEHHRKVIEKRMNERWRKALDFINIDSSLYPNKLEDILSQYPLNECSLAKALEGDFQLKKIERIIVEVVQMEFVNNLFSTKLKDIEGTEISSTFHNNCKDKIKAKKMNRRSIVVLQNVKYNC